VHRSSIHGRRSVTGSAFVATMTGSRQARLPFWLQE